MHTTIKLSGVLVALVACSASGHSLSVGSNTGSGGDPFDPNAGQCPTECSADVHSVLDCHGNVLERCEGTTACDLVTGTCVDACTAAEHNRRSVGCDYYATLMDQTREFSDVGVADPCFAVIVSNTWTTPAHLSVERAGQTLPVGSFAALPQGGGKTLDYVPFDEEAGIPPGETAILFLVGREENPHGVPCQPDGPELMVHGCPMPAAVTDGVMLHNQTGVADAFRIRADVPVVAYQVSPFNGGSMALPGAMLHGGGWAPAPGASLLLPTSAWDDNYLAVNAYEYQEYAAVIGDAFPSLNIVAMADDTVVTLKPVTAVEGGGGIPAGGWDRPMSFTLDQGQHAQISQKYALTGSPIQSTKPVGLMAGHVCMGVPHAGYTTCDHAEQMIPPIAALGHEYVAVAPRSRKGEPMVWRVMGAVDGTELSWSRDVGGPATLDAGQVSELMTGEPFVVASQDKEHPFMLFAYMVGAYFQPWLQNDGAGDSDFVLGVPPEQFLTEYVFFADPTYPETNLVVVRAKNDADVTLDCAGTLDGWQSEGDYEWTRVDLTTGDFQPVGGCASGRRVMTSDAPFGLWVWGWGSIATGAGPCPEWGLPPGGINTQMASYGYPAGMNVRSLNSLVIVPE